MPWLVESHGHVVVTASGLAVATMPYSAAYSASKRGVTAYADVLRSEYAGRITVTTVNPGYIRTAIHEVSAAAGASLEGVVPPDSLESAAAAYVRAVAERPRSCATSWRTAVNLGLARRRPAQADRVLRAKVARLRRAVPSFVLSEEDLAARRAAEEKATSRAL
jgi:short-subunit dehydrogenase